MKSRDSIKSELTQIATNLGYTGEVVDIATSLLSYVLYHNQVEIANAVQESSLTTAKLMNSKILQCMNNMYSVYRGRNARVKLAFDSSTLLNYDKFDLIYASNTFKVYASDAYSIKPGGSYIIEGIISKVDKIVSEVTITELNKYYLDLKDTNNHVLSNISEDIRVFIDDIEYPVTRNFYDHVNLPIAKLGTNEDLDSIFVLTIPDYGIRLFKRGYIDNEEQEVGYFPLNSVVRIEAMTFTNSDEINQSEFDKILIKGTSTTTRELIDDVSRENASSILYNANSSIRASKEIKSTSDISALFTEFFINYILYSDSRINRAGQYQDDNVITSDDNLYIFYIPIDPEYELDSISIGEFIEKYRSYLVSETILAYNAPKVVLNMNISIDLADTNEIDDEINLVLSDYRNKLPSRSQYSESQIYDDSMDWDTQYYSKLIDINELRSKIAKLSNVVAISELNIASQDIYLGGVLAESRSIENGIITSYLDAANNVRIPTYYDFNLSIKYNYKYESISKR